MYNKIFTKILDSSIWLAPDYTRLVWITFLAMMDEDGFVQLATAGNVANRARVSLEQAQKAIEELESPEPATATEDDDGRRIERVPGGWMVINAPKYRDMVTRAIVKEQTRARMQKYRKKLKGDAGVTHELRDDDAGVTPSDAASPSTTASPDPSGGFDTFWKLYPKKEARKKALEIWRRIKPSTTLQQIIIADVSKRRNGSSWKRGFAPNPTTYLNGERWNDESVVETHDRPATQSDINQAEDDAVAAGMHHELFKDALRSLRFRHPAPTLAQVLAIIPTNEEDLL